MKINKCICGKTPKLVEKKECYAHGEFPLLAWAECDCGITTRKKSRIINGYYGSNDTKDDVIKDWNEFINRIVKTIKDSE